MLWVVEGRDRKKFKIGIGRAFDDDDGINY